MRKDNGRKRENRKNCNSEKEPFSHRDLACDVKALKEGNNKKSKSDIFLDH